MSRAAPLIYVKFQTPPCQKVLGNSKLYTLETKTDKINTSDKKIIPRKHTYKGFHWVRLKGLEPPRREASDPKSDVATNYTTAAFGLRCKGSPFLSTCKFFRRFLKEAPGSLQETDGFQRGENGFRKAVLTTISELPDSL